MIRLGEIYGELKLRAGQFHKEFGRARATTEKQARLIRNAFLGVTAAIAGITYAVARVTKMLVTEYGKQEMAEKKLDAALKATANQVGITREEMVQMAEELMNVTTFGDELIITAQGIMVTFTKVGKEIFPDAIKAAMDMSTMFGQDLQQSVIQLGTALNDPIVGVGRLKRIGISFTEEQKKSIKTFMEQNDVMSAQKVILDELAAEFGGVAEAAATTTEGAIKQFKNALGEISEEFGEKLAPAISMYARLMKQSFNEMKKHLDVLIPSYDRLSKSTETANQAGLRFSIWTTVAVFKVRAGVDRLKITFWTLAGVVGKVIQIISWQFFAMSASILKVMRVVGQVSDKIFGTKLVEAIDQAIAKNTELRNSYSEFATEAFARAEELAGGLIGIAQRQEMAVKAIIREYERLIEVKGKAFGPPIAPGGGETTGGEGGTGAPPGKGKTLKEMNPEAWAKTMKLLADRTKKVKTEIKGVEQAATMAGSALAQAFTDANMTGTKFISTLIKMALQLAAMQIGGPLGMFLAPLISGTLEEGGFIVPPPFIPAQQGLFMTKGEGTYGSFKVGEKNKMEVIGPFEKLVDLVDKMDPRIQIITSDDNIAVRKLRDLNQEELDIIERRLYEKVIERMEEKQ